jgi:hypothetical protein
MTTPVPSAIKALQRQLTKARDGETRARLSQALAYVRRLYCLPDKPDAARDLDMKRRERICRTRHPFQVTRQRDETLGQVKE